MLLSAVGLSRSYDGVSVLSGVDFELEAGQVHALVGENGAGKSTFLKIVAGAVEADGGHLAIDGRPVAQPTPASMRADGIAVVYQELSLIPGLSVAENIFLGRERGRWWLDRPSMTAEAQRVLNDLAVAIDPCVQVGTLSIAQQQLVEIARAVAMDARILILDEPTATLSAAEVTSLFRVVSGMRQRGLGIVYVSHRLEEVFAIADRVTVLRDGAKVFNGATSSITPDQLVAYMVGRAVTHSYPQRRGSAGPVMLELTSFGSSPRFSDVSLVARAGEVVGLAGLVGAGRTSIGLAIAGSLTFQGAMRIAGRPARFVSPTEAIAAGVVYLTEDRQGAGIIPAMTVADNMTLSHLRRFRSRGWLSPARVKRWASEAAAGVDLRAASLDLPIRALSGGNQQKALIARSTANRPRVLILDEPTRGVDIGARAEIYQIINELAGAGCAVLLISSDLSEVIGMADRVVVMRDGRTVGELARQQATPEAVMALATGVAA